MFPLLCVSTKPTKPPPGRALLLLLVSCFQIHFTVARIWRKALRRSQWQAASARPPAYKPPGSRPPSPFSKILTKPHQHPSYWCSLQWDNSHCWKLHCRRKQCWEGFPNLGRHQPAGDSRLRFSRWPQLTCWRISRRCLETIKWSGSILNSVSVSAELSYLPKQQYKSYSLERCAVVLVSIHIALHLSSSQKYLIVFVIYWRGLDPKSVSKIFLI